MKKCIKLITVMLFMTITLSLFASCALFKNVDDADKSDSTGSNTSEAEKFTDKELETPVITIGERTVTLAEFIEFYEEIKSYYSTNYGYDIASDPETLAQYIDLISEELIGSTMELHKADELGLSTLNDEQKAEVEKRYEAELEEMHEYYREYAESDLSGSDSATAEDIEKKIEEYVLDEAAYYCGEGTTIEEYHEYLRNKEEEDYIKELLYEEVVKDVKASDEDVEKWYNDAAEDDEEYFTEHPESYKDECDSFETTGYISDGKTAVPPLYVPENYVRVYHIFTTSNEKPGEDYTDNEEKMTKLETEYGKLAFENATVGTTKANTDRMSEILREYEELKKENEKELKRIYKDAKKKIDEAYKKLENGEDFVEVMKEYTEDTNFTENKTYIEKGKLISTFYTSTSDWSDTVKANFRGLKKGEYTKVFLDEDGYHILYYVAKETSGVRSLKDVRQYVVDQILVDAKDKFYDKTKEDWLKDTSIIKRNTDLTDRVGK